MKKLLLILLIFSCFIYSCGDNAQRKTVNLSSNKGSIHDTVFNVPSLHDTAAILKLCFSPIKIVNNKTAVWKPSLEDFFNMPISNDSLCHSKIDTIVDLNKQQFIILFRTDAYWKNGKIIDAHVSSPTYSIASVKKEDKTFTIVNFKKNLVSVGSFGNGYDTLTIEKFGRNFQLLVFSSSYTGTSNVYQTKTYFDIDEFKQVFEYNTYHSIGDSTELDPEYSKTQQRLVHIPGKNNKEKDDIKLEGNITYFDKTDKKLKKRGLKEYYRIDDFGNYNKSLN